MKRLTPAEKVLQSLGISEPSEIDLEAIAWDLGAQIRIKPLDGCEARIIGNGKQAIITVNSKSHPRRQRFSIAHELGHWEFHRGRLMVCRSDDIGNHAKVASSAEKRADQYAADLIMPIYLFHPAMRAFSELSFNTIRKIADIFDVSVTASAIRLIDSGEYPAILICHGHNGRKWFSRSSLVPARWFPRSELQPESSAFNTLFGQRPSDSRIRCVGADAWFDRYDAHKFEIYEQTYRISDNEILSILVLEDEEMLEE